MNCCNRILAYGTLLSLNISLISCAFLRFQPEQTVTTSATPMASAVSPSAPAAQPTESTVPFTVLTAPPLVPRQSVRENYACVTANYYANIVWQQDQAKLTFGRKPNQTTIWNALVTVKSNSDGSFTYESKQASLVYARVYPDRTCVLQVVNPVSGIATLEEDGKLGELVIGQTNSTERGFLAALANFRE
jgi:hypothetical protein